MDARPLNRFIRLDEQAGILRCEAGVLLSEILELVIPKGWFLPVTPGTQFVTVGGAIANDVHGKNHHHAGTFGHHVRCFELLRSDGNRLVCSLDENPQWFCATVGGLGLTGLITWAEIQLRPIAHPYIRQETIRYSNLDEFFKLSSESDRDYEYTVAWVDCLAKGRALGRGIFMRANHAAGRPERAPRPSRRHVRVPFMPPISLVNHVSLRLFNALYYRRQRETRRENLCHYSSFFYPLDGILEWNRIYGPKGFFQYQCVIPPEHGKDAIARILQHISAAGMGSFLAVLKVFGDKPSPGLLSFPRPGVTLALDFPNLGERTLGLLDRLDEVTEANGGAVYPAKDAHMNAGRYQNYFPQWQELLDFIDPRFSSSFWRRVTGESP